MKLQRNTVILLISALVLGGFVYFSETQRTQKQEATKTTKQPIFAFKDDQIQSLTIYTAKDTLEFERVNGKGTNWRMKTPKDAPASDAAVSFLTNLIVEGKSDRSFTIPTNQRQEYGLDQPMATVKIQLKNKENYRLLLGKPDFNKSFLYASVNSPAQTPQQLNLLLVPYEFEYAVNRPLSEWQGQPEPSQAATPSPSPGGFASSPTPAGATPSPAADGSQPSPTPEKPKSSPTPAQVNPSPTPGKAKLSPTPAKVNPSPTPKSSASSPTPEQPKASPTPASSKPSPTPTSSKPASSPAGSKPSPTPASSKPASSPTASKPSPAPASSKPSRTPAASQPSPAPESPKPSPTGEKR